MKKIILSLFLLIALTGPLIAGPPVTPDTASGTGSWWSDDEWVLDPEGDLQWHVLSNGFEQGIVQGRRYGLYTYDGPTSRGVSVARAVVYGERDYGINLVWRNP